MPETRPSGALSEAVPSFDWSEDCVLFRDAGIATETQVWIDGVGRVDFLLEGFRIVELDGLASLSS